jgi:hypothetical protein
VARQQVVACQYPHMHAPIHTHRYTASFLCGTELKCVALCVRTRVVLEDPDEHTHAPEPRNPLSKLAGGEVQLLIVAALYGSLTVAFRLLYRQSTHTHKP